MEFSDYQKNIFNFIINGSGNALIEAVAGSGKTTTIVHGWGLISQNNCNQSVFLAFNKTTAEELKAKGLNAMTFHALGFYLLSAQFGCQMETTKLIRISREIIPKSQFFKYGPMARKLVGLAKQWALNILTPISNKEWEGLVKHYGLHLKKLDEPTLFDFATKILNESITQANTLDYDDMLFLSVVKKVLCPYYKFIFVDEAQDTNKIQRMILNLLMVSYPNTGPIPRLIAVGDTHQAIYGFRGADSDAMKKIKYDYNCTLLPLSISYRCAKEVVEYSKKWVPQIESSPSANQGIIKSLGYDWDTNIFNKNDMVLCRTVQPLIRFATKLISNMIPINIIGFDMKKEFIGILKDFRATDAKSLNKELALWARQRINEAVKKDDDALAKDLTDKVKCLEKIIETLSSDQFSNKFNIINKSDMSITEKVILVLQYLFADNDGLKIMSIHKSKGMEADRVFWLNRSSCPIRWVDTKWQFQQELNLCYVATTRAKDQLYFLDI